MGIAPRTPGEHHYREAERVLATVGSLGATPEEATREVGVAIAHAVLSGAASLLGQPFCENDHSPSGGTRPADRRSCSRTRYQV